MSYVSTSPKPIYPPKPISINIYPTILSFSWLLISTGSSVWMYTFYQIFKFFKIANSYIGAISISLYLYLSIYFRGMQPDARNVLIFQINFQKSSLFNKSDRITFYQKLFLGLQQTYYIKPRTLGMWEY